MSRYANLDPRHVPHGGAAVFRWAVLDRLTGRRRPGPAGPPAPRVPADLDAVRDPGGPPRITWIGHASFLVTLDGGSVLVDPVFSERIGAVVRRHAAPGLLAEDLPPLAAVLVTHNHYDHLDAPSIRSLPRDLPVLTAAGLGPWFRRRGLAGVRELRWWDTADVGPLRVTFVPARHWSRRYPWDTNRSLWGGFVVQGGGRTVYHAGDSAAFDGFRSIAGRFPAIDAALLPIGAYEPPWFMEWHHMSPEQAGEAYLTLGAKAMVPMHWGTFRLTDEPLVEPAERMVRWWRTRRPPGTLHVMAVGETLALDGSRAGGGGGLRPGS